MPSALLVQLRQLHPLEVSGSKPMPFAWLVQLRQLHPLEVSDSKPMPSALLVQLRQLHPLEVSCGFGGYLQGGALVSSAPTKQAMHQPNNNEFLLLGRFKQRIKRIERIPSAWEI